MLATQCCFLAVAESGTKVWPVKCIEIPVGFDCCPFWGNGSVAARLLLFCFLVCVWYLFCNADYLDYI